MEWRARIKKRTIGPKITRTIVWTSPTSIQGARRRSCCPRDVTWTVFQKRTASQDWWTGRVTTSTRKRRTGLRSTRPAPVAALWRINIIRSTTVTAIRCSSNRITRRITNWPIEYLIRIEWSSTRGCRIITVAARRIPTRAKDCSPIRAGWTPLYPRKTAPNPSSTPATIVAITLARWWTRGYPRWPSRTRQGRRPTGWTITGTWPIWIFHRSSTTPSSGCCAPPRRTRRACYLVAPKIRTATSPIIRSSSSTSSSSSIVFVCIINISHCCAIRANHARVSCTFVLHIPPFLFSFLVPSSSSSHVERQWWLYIRRSSKSRKNIVILAMRERERERKKSYVERKNFELLFKWRINEIKGFLLNRRVLFVFNKFEGGGWRLGRRWKVFIELKSSLEKSHEWFIRNLLFYSQQILSRSQLYVYYVI